MGSGVVAMASQCSQHWPHHPTNRLKNWPEYLYFLYTISQFLATHMCQVAHCAFCVMCTTHVHNPGPWPSVWQGHWVPQAVGPIESGYRGGVGHPQSQAWATNGAPNCPQLLHAGSGGPVGAMGPLGCGPRCPHQPIVGPCHNPARPHSC